MSTAKPWAMWAPVMLSVFLLGAVDWKTGYELNFFVFYFLPIGLAAWHLGAVAGIATSILSAAVWAGADQLSGHTYSTQMYAVWNTLIRLTAFVAIGWSVARIRGLLLSEQKSSETLRRTLSEVRVLEGLVPICAQCKKIRDAEGIWQPMEIYIGERSGARFSHGYCPECARQAMEEAGLGPE